MSTRQAMSVIIPSVLLACAVLSVPAAAQPAPGLAVLTGHLETLFIERSGSCRPVHTLVEPSGARHRLLFAGEIPAVRFADTIQVRARPEGDSLSVHSWSVVARSPTRANPNHGPQNTLVLMVNSYQDPSEPWSVQEIETRIFDRANPLSLNNFVQETSYGKASIRGDVLGWYTLPITRSQMCSYSTLVAAALLAADNDAYYPDYRRLLILFPTGACGWQAAGTIGMVLTQTPDGPVLMSRSYVNSPPLGLGGTPAYGGASYHEFGHNFGGWHSNDWECDDLTLGGNSRSIPYGDPIDTLGKSGAKGLYGPLHRELMGWFGPDHLLTTNEPGVYRLTPLETPTRSLKALKIPRGDGLHYYVEFRRPIGFDAEIFRFWSPNFDGALVRTDQFAETGDAQLLDMTPHANTDDTDQFFDSLDSALAPGRTFADPNHAIYLTTLGVSDEFLAVRLGHHCPADFNADGVVDNQDVLDYYSAWIARDPTAEYTGDDSIDNSDLIAWFDLWSAGC